jgi:ribonuclease D
MLDTAATQDVRSAVPLLEPRDGMPAVVADNRHLSDVIAAFAAGSGPVAVDAERASGYRYGQRAYLVQLRRVGAGTALIDPIACPDLTGLGTALRPVEWVVHAALQDLPGLAELGMRPVRLFDTELAGRLLGYERVGLGTMVETVLGYVLEKGHSAVDWSTRPLPAPWLRYAALDVEVLVELRDALEHQLREQGKLDWAREEFAALVAAAPAAPRQDPWRRTSGVHRVRGRRGLAVVRSLWEARDELARTRDMAPGRVLPDAAIVEAALTSPRSRRDLAALPQFAGRGRRRYLDLWWSTIRSALALPDTELPPVSIPVEGPPPARSWGDRDPAAAERLTVLRSAVAAIADEHHLPTENLLAPDTVRRIAWSPPVDAATDAVAAALREHGARSWQIELTAVSLAGAIQRLRAHDLDG